MVKQRILFIGQLLNQITGLSDYLTAHDFVSHTITDEKDIVQRIHQFDPAIVIIDDEFTSGSYYNIIRQLRNHPTTASLSIILCLASNFDKAFQLQQDWARKLGANEVLAKPVEAVHIIALIEQITASSSVPLNNTTPAHQTSTEINSSPSKTTATPAISNESLLEIEQLLAKHMGPIAKLMVQRTAENTDNRRNLIVQLANQITDDSAKRQFLDYFGLS